MRPFRTAAAIVASALALACTDESPTSDAIRLSAAQADIIASRIGDAVAGLAGKGRDDLVWLADSVDLVVRSGGTVDSISIVETDGPARYFAVGIQRRIAVNGQATFHLIGFDDLDNPTRFVVVGAYASNPGGAPPQTAFGTFSSTAGGVTLSGFLMELAGAEMRAWRAVYGDASFATAGTGAACAGFSTTGVTCAISRLQTSFAITYAPELAPAPGGAESRTATLATVSVPGVLLTFAAP